MRDSFDQRLSNKFVWAAFVLDFRGGHSLKLLVDCGDGTRRGYEFI